MIMPQAFRGPQQGPGVRYGEKNLQIVAIQEAVFQRIEIEVSGWANIHKVEIFGVATATGLGVSEITHAD